jgi:hypothetical protein
MTILKLILRAMKRSTSRRIVVALRKARDVDKVYNNVVNPVTLYEITWDDVPDVIPDVIPYEATISHFVKNVPYMHNIVELYDAFTTDKDIVETFVAIFTKLKNFETMEERKRAIYMVKVYTFLYKFAWIALACCGVPKTHDHLVCILDYVNFVLSSIAD